MESDSRLNSEKGDVFRVAIVTNIVPHYREDFYERISRFNGFEFNVYCQKEIRESGIVNISARLPVNVTPVRYIGLSGDSFGIQVLPLREILENNDAFIIHGNPRVLSNIWTSLLLRCMRKQVAIWGQARTSSAKKPLENLKLAWWKLFQVAFIYNRDEVSFLRHKGFDSQYLAGMNNGLNQAAIEKAASGWTPTALRDWQTQKNLTNSVLLLSCARLTPKNQFELMVRALPSILEKNKNVIWHIIGDGPEKNKLLKLAQQLNVEANIRFLGQIMGEDELAPWFLSSKLFVHPSGIGLSLMHAFGYGLPVITHGDHSHHMPEFAALKAGINGAVYERGSPVELGETVNTLLADPGILKTYSENARYTATIEYNTEVMARNFLGLCCKLKSMAEKAGRPLA